MPHNLKEKSNNRRHGVLLRPPTRFVGATPRIMMRGESAALLPILSWWLVGILTAGNCRKITPRSTFHLCLFPFFSPLALFVFEGDFLFPCSRSRFSSHECSWGREGRHCGLFLFHPFFKALITGFTIGKMQIAY